MSTISLTINNVPVTAPAGSTILDAARSVGIDIPTLCHLPGLSPSGACRICVVELEGRNGLTPSCAFPAANGMKVLTHSPRVVQARKAIIELLLANHPQECLTCVRSGNCELQTLAQQYGVREVRFSGSTRKSKLDVSSPSLVRDSDKCILCGRCVRVCDEVQSVGAIDFIRRGFQTRVGPAHNKDLNLTACVGCGQCVLVCPTGALAEQSAEREVWDALNDKDRMVVVQTAPAVRVALAEEFGLPAGTACTGKMVAGLKRLGFAKVFDTLLSADLTIMEEGSELVHRIKNNGVLPMMTSCSPGWIKFVEHFYPDFIPNLSTCKSPQQMLGAVIKHFWARKAGVDPRKVFVVSVMPCTAKKLEARRPEMATDGIPDVDAVLTTRELARMIRMMGIDFSTLAEEQHDDPLGLGSGAGDIFGTSGGVMEAALRTAYHLVTGKELGNVDFTDVRGVQGLKEAEVDLDGLKVKVAAVNSLSQARKVLERIRSGEAKYHFIEVMTCPGGCIGGGGQPLGVDRSRVVARMKSTYAIDASKQLRKSHHNTAVQALYQEYFHKPLSEVSHKHLHTHYQPRTPEG